MVMMMRLIAATVALAVAAAASKSPVDASSSSSTSSSSPSSLVLEPWQECSIFIAPSSSGGYGVFAAREFVEDEIVEVAPFFLPADHGIPYVINSALQDYIYGYLREGPDLPTPQVLSAIVWGMTMLYNHHSQAPNLKWSSFAHEPTLEHPHFNRAVGFRAARFIEKGEELFSTYGVTDGGATWFRERHLTMITNPPEATRIPLDQLPLLQQQYCSKIYADVDDATYQEKLEEYIQPPTFYHPSRLAPSSVITQNNHHAYNDPLFPYAVAKVPIAQGERIEVAPALVLDRKLVVNMPLAPLVYYWYDLNDELQASVRTLREQGYYVVQYQGIPNQWYREDYFTTLEDSVILPVGGWIGRVERVGGDISLSLNTTTAVSDPSLANCKMRILPSDFHNNATTTATTQQRNAEEKKQNPFSLGSAGIVLELIATRDIAVGERLRVHLPLSAGVTFHERLALYKEIERSGQIYTRFDHHERSTQPQLQQQNQQQQQHDDTKSGEGTPTDGSDEL